MSKIIYLPTIKISRDDAKIYPITSSNYILRFDGGSRGNPGLSGCGAVIYHNCEEIWSGYMFIGDNVTNNYAEYSGLILGLKQALELNIYHLLVEGDSLLVINQLTNVYKCKSENLLELNETAKRLATEFSSIHFQHILRSKNKRADQLANFSIDQFINRHI
jgi:ribonuclease HI